jgi:hypothetical protein
MAKIPTYAELISKTMQRPVSDDQLSGVCAVCSTAQTLAEATKKFKPTRLDYRCKKGCSTLTSIIPDGAGFKIEVNVPIAVDIKPISKDPKLS